MLTDGSEANGYILSSDANCVASWILPSNLPGISEWNDNGSVVHPNELNDSVIIGGTTTGAADILLGVNGNAILIKMVMLLTLELKVIIMLAYFC